MGSYFCASPKLGACDGLELLQDIRNHYYELPVILCRAYEIFKKDPKSIAADHYVVKSFDISELKTKIEMAIEASLPFTGRGEWTSWTKNLLNFKNFRERRKLTTFDVHDEVLSY